MIVHKATSPATHPYPVRAAVRLGSLCQATAGNVARIYQDVTETCFLRDGYGIQYSLDQLIIRYLFGFCGKTQNYSMT